MSFGPISQLVLNGYSAQNAGTIPPAALAVGYTTKTFTTPFVYAQTGDSVSNQNLAMFTFFGFNSAPSTPPIQQGDGTILLRGGDTANAGAATAWVNNAKQNNWGGVAFGGGLYLEFTAKFTPFVGAITGVPALWMMNIEHLSGVLAWSQWSGQVAGFQHWGEKDVMEYNHGNNSQIGQAYHDWWKDNANPTQNQSSGYGAVTVPGGLGAGYHKYGSLWVPATPFSLGRFEWYIDDILTNAMTYAQYIANSGFPPPPIAGVSSMAIMDSCHIVPIIGNGNSDGHVADMTVSSIAVWQKSSSMNLIQ